MVKSGFVLLLGIIAIMAFVSPMMAQEEPPCVGEIECYEPSPVSGGGSQPVVDFVPEPLWDGLTDGRLNPDMAEYYSVYCPQGSLVIMVLRAVPPPTALVDNIPIMNVVELGDGGSFARDSGLTVSRSGDDVTIAGNNGNLAPQEGQKSFRLQQCLERAESSLDDLREETTVDVQGATINDVAVRAPQTQLSLSDSEESSDDSDWTDPRSGHPFWQLYNFIVEFIEQVCAVPMVAGVFILPTGLSLLRRRGRKNPQAVHSSQDS
jgi:hypothetical protein